MTRAVVDTNILIRAVIRPLGTVGPIARRLRQGAYVLIISEPLLHELIEELNAPRIGHKYGIDAQAIQDFVAELAETGELVQPSRTIAVCRDEDDNRVLEAAVEGRANYIVTGDNYSAHLSFRADARNLNRRKTEISATQFVATPLRNDT
ncbi:MAG: putative toxin-antitoxin system toxin component, PIN family [Chloroflexi bacterium]|nr:putative toxin-antitoxin system toxin component, PIN family [Chloroflexota bacterium]